INGVSAGIHQMLRKICAGAPVIRANAAHARVESSWFWGISDWHSLCVGEGKQHAESLNCGLTCLYINKKTKTQFTARKYENKTVNGDGRNGPRDVFGRRHASGAEP